MRMALGVAVGLVTSLCGCTSNTVSPTPAGSAIASGERLALPSGDAFENPLYTRWSKFPPGTTVTQRTTTENADSPLKTVTDITYTLKEKSDDSLVVEFVATTTHPDGRLERNPPQENRVRKMFVLPRGAKKAQEKKFEEGDESLTVAGRVFPTRWHKGKDFTEAGELSSQTWSSDEMPGGLVKSVSQVPAKRATITVEVVEVKIPAATP